MNKQEIYALLREKRIEFEITEHPAVFTMEDLEQVELPYPDLIAKNLFVRDDKHQNYYLITVKDDKHVNLKEFRQRFQTRPLTFASPEELAEFLFLTPGSVTPLGLLNDASRRVHFYLDADFLSGAGQIGIHPCDNTATVWMQAKDLLALTAEHGNPVDEVKF